MLSLKALDGGVHETVEIVDGDMAIGDFSKAIFDVPDCFGEDLAELEDGVDLLGNVAQVSVLLIGHLRAEQKIDYVFDSSHGVVVVEMVSDEGELDGNLVVASHICDT